MRNTLVALASLALTGCMSSAVARSSESVGQDPAASATHLAQPPAVTRVEPSLVCMVNNQFMGKPQIPVDVGGKTYFGCCEMCKARLANDPAARTAVDPTTGAKVDKAVAVIGRDSAGAVHYFENEANLMRYHAPGS